MLNWLTRYAPALATLESQGPLGSVLDVGSGPHGLACVRPGQAFVGVDIAFPSAPVDTMVAFEIEPGPLPFADASFDTVLCLDSLEHIPRPDRRAFVVELARVAANRLLIACPTDASASLDDHLRRMWQGGPLPGWLEEHGRYVLPTAAEVEAVVRDVEDFDAVEVPMGNMHLQSMLVLGDLMPEFAAAAQREAREHAAAWTELLASTSFGPSLRAGWLLVRRDARTSLVSESDLEASATAALRPPGAIMMSGPRAGTVMARDTAATHPTRDESGNLLLWLAPDWSVADSWVTPLAAYIESAPTDGSVCLCLDASLTAADAETVVRAVSQACDGLAGDDPFGDVVVVTETGDRELATEVRTAEDVRTALAAG